MTEVSPESDLEAVDILEDWMESGTVNRVEVVLPGDMAIAGELKALAKRRAEVEADAADGDRSISEVDPMVELDAAEDALMKRWQDGKSTWTLRPLTGDEEDGFAHQFVDPSPPQMLPKAAPAAAKAKWDTDRNEWRDALRTVTLDRNLHRIATAVVKVETAKGSKASVTVEQLRAIRSREYGPERIDMLFAALDEAGSGKVQMPAPKLREHSVNGLS